MYRGFPPYPPPNYQGMPRPPYPYDARYRHPPPPLPQQRQPQQQQGSEGDENFKRPAIITDKDLREFDEILRLDDKGGWANPQEEIDYTEKLVFSDEEDEDGVRREKKDKRSGEKLTKENHKDRQDRKASEEESRKDDENDNSKSQQGEDRSSGPREAWIQGGPMPPQYRGPRPPHPGMDGRSWQMPPFDFMGPRGPYPPYRMAPPPLQGQRLPFPPHSGPSPVPSPSTSPSQGPPSSGPSPGPPVSPRKAGDDDDDVWRQRRQERNQEVTSAIERARQRREEEEKRMEAERKKGAAEKLRLLDERTKRKDGAADEKDGDFENKSDGRASETQSDSSEKSDRPQSRDGNKYSQPGGQSAQYGGKQYGRSVPPRFQKQLSQEGAPQSGGMRQSSQQPQPQQGPPTSPQPSMPSQMRPGQGPPPPWASYPWAHMPPHAFIGFRAPLDMQGMPMYQPMRRRTDSHGSGPENAEESGRPDIYDQVTRDPRAWYGPPHPYDEMRRPPMFDQRMYELDARGHEEHRREMERRGDRELDKDPYEPISDKEDFDDYEAEDERREKELDRQPIVQKEPVDDIPERENRRTPVEKTEKIDHSRRPIDREERIKPIENERKDDEKWQPEEERDKVKERERDDRDRRGNREETDSRRDQPYDRRGQETRDHVKRDTAWSTSVQSRSSGYQKREHPSCPPPIPLRESQQNLPPRSNYTSLKRTASNMSTASTVSSDKKNDSPRDVQKTETPEITAKPSKIEPIKEHDTIKETIAEPKNEKLEEQKKEERLKVSDSIPEDKEDKSFEKERKEDRGNREDRRDRNVPPAKRMRDEPGQRDRDHYGRGGREFVRGRGRTRARGSTATRGYRDGRGRGGGSRDYRNYDGRSRRVGNNYSDQMVRTNSDQASKNDHAETFTMGKWEDHQADEKDGHTECEDVNRRPRDREEESDVSVDENSGSYSESSNGRVPEARDMSRSKAPDRRDFTRLKDERDRYVQRDNRGRGGFPRDGRGGFPKSNDNRPRRNEDNRQRRDDVGYKDRREKEDRGDQFRSQQYDDTRDDQQGKQGQINGGPFLLRGEPSRIGRGGSAYRGHGGSNNNAGGRRYNSAPPGRGGFVRPSRDQHPDEREGDMGYRKEKRRSERSSPPPRFARRGGERGRGRGKGRGAPSLSVTTSKRPQLIKENSSDMANEEWETASESSEILEKSRDPKTEGKDNRDRRDGSSTKKSFSSQRPLNDRQNRKGNSNSDQKKGNGFERPKNSNKEKSPNSSKNGISPSKNGSAGRRPNYNSSRKENINAVYRVDEVVPNDQTVINNAINSLNNKNKSSKKNDLSDVSKPLKIEKEKKDALANIDINNYAGVVIIDDQPEVSFDDPNFLFENNEGFQEVQSKKALKSKQKAQAQEAEMKKQTEMLKKREPSSKVLAKPKGVHSSSDKPRFSKLPPRLAKQREQQRERSKSGSTFMAKIENWDNELANHIPPPPSVNNTATVSPSVMNVTEEMENTKNLLGPFSTAVGSLSSLPVQQMQQSMQSTNIAVNLPPAPAPVVNAWNKPISFAAITGSVQVQVSATETSSKFDKGDQHDSGIDVSDHPNSAGSSTRSSPSAENKLKRDMKADEKNPMKNEIDKINSPKPQRQPKAVRSEKVSVKEVTSRPESGKVIKKPDLGIGIDKVRSTPPVVMEKPQPIQLPPSFKDTIFGKGDDASEMKLDFTFDAELAKITEEKLESEKLQLHERASSSDKMSMSGVTSTNQGITINSPTSPAAQDLNMKIASVKNVWDIPSVASFEQSMAGGSGSVVVSTASFHSFSSNLDHETTGTGMELENVVGMGDENNSNNLRPGTMSPQGQDNLCFNDESDVRTAFSTTDVSFGPGDDDVMGPVFTTANMGQGFSSSGQGFSMANVNQSLAGGDAGQVFSNDTDDYVTEEDVGSMFASDQGDETNQKMMVLEQPNVCKVKPQQLQYMTSSAIPSSSHPQSQNSYQVSHTPSHEQQGPHPSVQQQLPMSSSINLSGLSAVPSPPMMLQQSQHPFQTFALGTQILQPLPEPRLNQASFGFGLSQTQPLTQLNQPQSFTQQNLFLPTPPAQQQDPYQPAPQTQLSSYQRGNQPFGQQNTPSQQNTVMVSSTSSLMSTSIKPPAHNAYGTTLPAKNLGHGSMQFGQTAGLSNTGLQPSQQISFIQYDPNNQMFGTSQILGTSPTTQNVNSSQLLGSHLIARSGTGLQNLGNLQPVQTQTNFYQQAQQGSSLQQTGFFPPTQHTSTNMQFGNNTNKLELSFQFLQGLHQQQQQAAAGTPTTPQFSLSSSFGSTGPSGLNMPLQVHNSAGHSAQSGHHMNLNQPQQQHSVGGKGSTQFGSQATQQMSPAPNSSMKSSPLNLPPSSTQSFSSAPGTNVSSKPFTPSSMQNRQNTGPRFQGIAFNFNTNMQPNAAQQFGAKFNPFVNQTMPSGVVRPSMLMGNLLRPGAPGVYPNPIQRPAVQIPPPRPQLPQHVASTTSSGTSAQGPQLNVGSSGNQQGLTKAMQAKQRQDLLAHTQNFLNPNKFKPKNGGPQKTAEASVDDKKNSSSTCTQSTSVVGNITKKDEIKVEEKAKDKK
ncbi:hypothetical protein ACJMK2_040253 [Sinanodonta woodiana]|uniref:BAT2 N-terminal domain-containing protein n=1 Tax=Sinanodonta woodiana TaxID=1069815 RepID=A0ABD3WEM5_SINWO